MHVLYERLCKAKRVLQIHYTKRTDLPKQKIGKGTIVGEDDERIGLRKSGRGKPGG